MKTDSYKKTGPRRGRDRLIGRQVSGEVERTEREREKERERERERKKERERDRERERERERGGGREKDI